MADLGNEVGSDLWDDSPNVPELQNLAVPVCIANAMQNLNPTAKRDQTLTNFCIIASQFSYK